MKSQYFIHSQKRQADDGLHDNDFRTEIKQAAFEPNNLVPGIGSSRRGSLLACLLFYTGAYRARMGVNYTQIPVRARTGSWRSTI